MSTIFSTTINYREQGPDFETPVGESLTQPDQVMSVREMLTRHVRGLPVPNAKDEGMFYEDEYGYVPSLAELDLSEIADYRDHYKRVVERLTLEEQKARENASANVPKSDEVDKPQERASQGDSDSGVES